MADSSEPKGDEPEKKRAADSSSTETASEKPAKKSRWSEQAPAPAPTLTAGTYQANLAPPPPPQPLLQPPPAAQPNYAAYAAMQRPAAYGVPAANMIPPSVNAVGNIAGFVAQRASSRSEMEERDSKRLFVGNLPQGLLAHELQTVFAPLGATGAEIPNPGKSFGFVQFADPQSAMTAMNAMNGFELAGRSLRVSRPHNSRVVNQQPTTAAAAYGAAAYGAAAYGAAAYGAAGAGGGASAWALQQQQHAAWAAYGLQMGQQAAAGAALPAPVSSAAAAPPPPTQKVMVLKNISDEIDDELKEDVKSECEKFGEIKEIRMKVEHAADDTKKVDVEVEFAGPAAAATARAAMDNRYFGGRVVKAELA